MSDKKVAIIIETPSYHKNSLQACSELDITPAILPWTENLEQDIENLLEVNADIFLIQLSSRHHGAKVCKEAAKYGIQGKNVTSGSNYDYSIEEGGNGGCDVETIKHFLSTADCYFTDTDELFRQKENQIESTYKEALAKIVFEKVEHKKKCNAAQKRHNQNPG